MAADPSAVAPAQPAPLPTHLHAMAGAAAQAGIDAVQKSNAFTTQMQSLDSQLSAQQASVNQTAKEPKAPKIETAQDVQAPKATGTQAVFQSLGTIVQSIMGAVLSSSTRGAGAAMGSLFAINGFYTAIHNNDLQQAKLKIMQTRNLMEEAQQHNEMAFAQYNAILRQNQLTMEQKLAALRVTAMQLHDVAMEKAANDHDLLEAATLSAHRAEAAQSLGIRKEALMEKMNHDADMAGLAADRVHIEAARAAKSGATGKNGVTIPDVIRMAVADHESKAQDYARQMSAYQKTVANTLPGHALPALPVPPPPINYHEWFRKYGISVPEDHPQATAKVPPVPASISEMKIGQPYLWKGKEVQTLDGKTVVPVQ